MLAAKVIVSSPPRGPGNQEAAEFYLSKLEFTESWGIEPGSAVCTYVRETVANESVAGNGVSVGASVMIELLNARWVGICHQDSVVDASNGKDRALVFRDLRQLLQWDWVFCQFNMEERRLVYNPQTGRQEWLRMYRHIFPHDWSTGRVTRTTAPLMAIDIFNALAYAPTVQSPWSFVYHFDQHNNPILNVDFLKGSRLDAAIASLMQAQGLTCRLSGYFQLRFGRKGEVDYDSTFPVDANGRYLFSSALDDECADGFAIGEAPTRVFVVGERNVYQVFNIGLEPDWNREWEQFWDPVLLVDFVFRNVLHSSGVTFSAIPGDTENVIGWQLAFSRGYEMTVGEFATLFGEQYADRRKYQGRCRMDMPAALYIQHLLFRAFRPPDNIFMGDRVRAARDMDLSDRMLVPVTHSPTTGLMTTDLSMPLDGNGYVIVRGYQVGSETFEKLQPSRVRAGEWIATQDLWAATSFQLEDNGESKTVLLESPVIRSSDLLVNVNGQAVFKARPTFTIPQVMATLTFIAEPFSWVVGNGAKDMVVNEPGLYSEIITDATNPSLQELAYYDGMKASQKAEQLGQMSLNRNWIERSGGFRRALTEDGAILGLNGMYDRISVRCDETGQEMIVDFTNARGENAFVPTLRYERRVMGVSLFQGQAELREQARQARALAAALRSDRGFLKTLADAFKGVGEMGRLKPVTITGGSGTLNVGTPLWKTPSTVSIGSGQEQRVNNTRPVMPGSTSATTTEFVGVTVRDGEVANSVVNVRRNGTVLARVKGPVEFGGIVGRSNAADYLKAITEKADLADPNMQVGRAQMAIATTDVMLIEVLMGVGGAGAAPAEQTQYRALWG